MRPRPRTPRSLAGLTSPGWVPWLMVALGITLSVQAWRYASSVIETGDTLELKSRVARAKDLFNGYLLDYFYAAHRLQGAVEGNALSTRAEMGRYLRSSGIAESHPGFVSLQFVRRVTAAARSRYLDEVRGDRTLQQDGHPNFAIRPQGERPEYLVVDYVEPAQPNEALLGLDVLTEPALRAAAERARDSGKPAATGPGPARGDEPGGSRFTLYLPVYRGGALHGATPARRQAFLGLVGVEFGAEEFMQPLLSRDAFRNVRVVIRDSPPPGAGALPRDSGELVFDSRPAANAAARAGARPADARRGYGETMSVAMGDRDWAVTFEAAAPPGSAAEATLPLLVLVAGTVASLLVFGLAWSLSTSRDRAVSLATRMTEGLRDSEARARAIGEMLPIPMLTARLEDGAIITMNRRAVELFGVSAESAVGTPLVDYCAEPAKCKRLMAHLRRHDHVRDFELRLKSASAEPIWVMLSARIIQHQAERILLVAMVDISDRMRAEEALRESEQEFRLIAERSGDMIAVVDPDGRRLYNNPAYARLLGNVGELPGTDSLEDIHPEDRERVRGVLADTVATGQGHRAQYRLMSRDGSVRHIESQGNAIHDETGKVSRIVVVSRDITEHKLAEEKIRHLAHHDALTGLPNRVLLRDRLEQAIAQAQRNRTHMGVLILDMDRFKEINDSLGHAAGDQALRIVAERLRASVRRVDTVARLGGDEFVVVLPSIRGSVDAEQIARKIIESMARPLTIKEQPVQVSTSIGASIFPADGADATELMKRADMAMFRAKQQGRNCYQPYSAIADTDGWTVAAGE
ncbi:MAG: diguanylate cyclase [Burkholderiales bacterium]|nr:diguanylate cyclase [Burkholderiales bacterium]